MAASPAGLNMDIVSCHAVKLEVRRATFKSTSCTPKGAIKGHNESGYLHQVWSA